MKSKKIVEIMMGLRLRSLVWMSLLVFIVSCSSEDTSGVNDNNGWNLGDNDVNADTGTDIGTDTGTDTGEDPDVIDETCSDGVQNGDETDIDCGGSCEPCEQDQSCSIDDDCDTDHCRDGICAAPRADLGHICDRDHECTSGQCEQIGDEKYCTEPCETTCSDSGIACFEDWCTPLDYCENESGFGYGPGCEGTPCDQCDVDATCSQSGESYECICRDGYRGDGYSCEDIDECTEELDDCHELAICTNTPGAYECDCPDGYSGDGTVCEDIDECADGLDSCHDLATCTNTPGAYECDCPTGYSGDGTVCEDIDECSTDQHSCDDNATCTNTAGSYQCECDEGFDGDGHSCTSIDHCSEGTHSCDDNAHCFPYPGGYSCSCRSGWQGDGHHCTDIDECTEGTNQCHDDAICTNTEGSYYCECPSGFTGGGYNCTDINECTDGTHTCDDNASCTNTHGSYECDCVYGYSGDGHTCLLDGTICDNALQIDDIPFVHESTTVGAGNDYSVEADWCPGFAFDVGGASTERVYRFTPSLTAEYRLELTTQYDAAIYIVTDCQELSTSCLAGIDDVYSAGTEAGDVLLEAGTTYFIILGGWHNDVNIEGNYDFLIDYNECLNDTADCHGSAICEKDGTTYECTCDSGFEYDGTDCVDIDECTEGTDSCDENATCTNTPGSYECECNDPFIGDGSFCWDSTVPGETCENPFIVDEPLPFETDGSTTNVENALSFSDGDCPGVTGSRGSMANDQVHAYTPSASGDYIITLESDFDPVLYVVSDCDDIANTCLGASDAVGSGADEVLELTLDEGMTYFIVVDGYSTHSGDYTLIVEEAPEAENEGE